MIDNFVNLLQTNSTINGAITLMISGSLIYLLKSVPMTVYNKLVSFFSTSVTITNYNISYFNFLKWFETSRYKKYSRVLQLTNGKWGYENMVTFSAGQGNHYFVFDNKIMKANVIRQKDSISDSVKEEVVITYLGRNHVHAENLVKAINIPKKKDAEKYTVYTYSEGWREICTEYKRDFNTVFLNEEIKETLLTHIDNFLKSKEQYLNKGIPYRTTILLHGEPGTGKTSIIKALATKYNLDIALIEPGASANLKKALCSAPKDSIVCIEDVDSLSGALDRTQEKDGFIEKFEAKKSSEILNALDGIGSFNDKILLMSTNHLDKLDPAFLRPGRVDLILEIPKLDTNNLDISEDIKLKIKESSIKGCELQQLLINKAIQ